MAIRPTPRGILWMLLCASLAPTWVAVNHADGPAATEAEFELSRVQGRIGWLGEALHENLGLEVSPDAEQRTLAITTESGDVIPLLEDSRGRAFRLDERLRRIEVQLLVRRYEKTPVLQVLQIFEVSKDGSLAELDYWCDTCAIAMYELKSCECCQGPIELRRRPVKP